MSTFTQLTQEQLSRVRPPRYEQPDIPVSVFSRWFIVAATLDNHGWRLAGLFGLEDVTATASAAARRRDWEVMGLAMRSDRQVVQEARQLREAASAASTGEMPACTEDNDSDGQTSNAIAIQPAAARAEAEIAEFEATPRPELTGHQRVIAAAALACHIVFGDGPTREDAADVLFTDLGHVSGEAINTLAAMQPAGVQ